MTTLRRVDYGPHDTAVDVATGLRLLGYPDGTWRFEHPCKAISSDEQLVCAPRLQTEGGGHQVTGTGMAITVTPSISCPDCGTHGFITNGAWRSC